ncbi:hypothetical protein ABGB17_08750 [Sphaerisporangium sp. B11E5]|uniref:hypothetical protein n=1 Tax=Sphaerisporangium sp. B11E5 TaxID=3153563 RepID=UPI00325E53FF
MPETRISMGEGAPDDAYDALRRLVSGTGTGHWARPPDRIETGPSLAGGRDVAEVFEITAYWGNIRWRYVVKLGPPEEMAEEWRAYAEWFGSRSNSLCAPIELATPVARGAEPPVGRRREAVVYNHVGDFSATPDAPLETLEDLAVRAVAGGPALAAFLGVIGTFGAAARQVLYNGPTAQEGNGSLRGLASTLGTHLTLEADRFDARGRLVAGTPTDRELDALVLDPAPLLARCLAPGPAGGPPAEVRLGPVPVTGHEDGTATARPSGMSVTVVPGHPGLDLRDVDRTVDVHGRVTAHLTAARWAMVTRVCPGLRREGREVVCGPDRTPVPFARLWDVLTAEEPHRPVSLVHGDLNPRNVMLSGGRPFLIDFPKTAVGHLSADLCWLELGLLRDVLAEHLTFGESLLLNRLLALASRAVDAVPGDDPESRCRTVESAFLTALPSCAPTLLTPFRMLWSIRGQSRSAHPATAGPPWWRDHAAHLIVSANRMLKWPDHAHTPAKLQATLTTAGAATETWESTPPYHRWPPPVLRAVTTALIPRLAPLPAAAGLAAALAGGLDGTDGRLEACLRDLRDGIVRAASTGSPSRPARQEKYFPLTAFGLDENPPGGDVQDLLATTSWVTLAGGALSGKSTILREHAARLTHAATLTPAPFTLRFPLPLDARALGDAVADGEDTAAILEAAWTETALPAGWPVGSLVSLGAVCLLVDGFERVEGSRRAQVAAWLRRHAEDTPRGAMVVTWRQTTPLATDAHGLDTAPFHLRMVAPPDPTVAAQYVSAALRANGVEAHTARAEAVVARALQNGSPGTPDDDTSSRWPSRAIGAPGLLPLITTLAATTRPAELSTLNPGTLLERYVRHLTDARHGIPPAPAYPDPRMGFTAPVPPPASSRAGGPAYRQGDPARPASLPGGPGGAGSRSGDAALPVDGGPPVYAYRDKEPVLAALARALTDRRAEVLDEADLHPLLDPLGPGRWPAIVDELVDEGLLTRAGDGPGGAVGLLTRAGDGPGGAEGLLTRAGDGPGGAEGLLTRAGDGPGGAVGFSLPVLRDYFAARWLLGRHSADRATVTARVTDFRWHEPLRLLLNLLEGGDETVTAVVSAATGHDLGLAVEFLRAPATTPAGALTAFTRHVHGVLTGSGPRSRARAAMALTEYGGRAAREVLGAVAADAGAPDESRVAALRGLARLARHDDGAAARTAALSELRRAAGAVLSGDAAAAVSGDVPVAVSGDVPVAVSGDVPVAVSGDVPVAVSGDVPVAVSGDVPVKVAVAALDAVGRAGVQPLSPRVAELVDPARPWPVTEAAMRALRALDTDPTPALVRRWTAACEHRLAATEHELTALPSPTERPAAVEGRRSLTAPAASYAAQVRLTEERRVLLRELAEAGRVDVLLDHRFRFDLDDEAGRALDEVVRRGDARVPGSHAGAWETLTGPGDRAGLLRLFATAGEEVATAAAHRLLPEEARSVVRQVDAGSGNGRLLAAAGAVVELDAAADADVLERVEEVVGRVAEAPGGAGGLETVAALVCAVFAIDRGRGVRLALRTALRLEEADEPGRMTWPWAVAFGRAVGSIAEVVRLAEDGDDVELAIFGLSGAGFLLDAAPGPEPRLGERGRAGFLRARPAPEGRAAWRYVMAAATVGLTDVLPYACDLAAQPGYGTEPALAGTGAHGLVEETDLAGVLSAVGHLARLTASQASASTDGPFPEVARAHTLLLGFPVEGAHPSVAAGRLAGLAYLGDWRAVLEGYTRDDPRLTRIAGHAVRLWAADQAGAPGEAARWIAARLRTGTDLPPGVRSVLAELQRECEHLIESFVEAP